MKLKTARTGFVCAFTALFAFIAIMGEGLHFLPGMGHSCACHFDCIVSSPSATDLDGCCDRHFPAVTHSDTNSCKIKDAADCPVCMFLSLAKSCLSTQYAACDCLPIVERLAVCSPLLESRFVYSYHTRAPPREMLHV
ncbi:MAG: hypothetical protein ABSG67_06425 [Thermoguttaceae bacterium]